ncbi:Tad domain-containing protein [Yoonia litorea]|nr:Tad domain-containing protein [Yoonia litorea]
MTVWGLFVWFCCGILGALALDVTYLISGRTQLQVAADQVAHAAIYQRNLVNEEGGIKIEQVNAVKTVAADLVRETLPQGRYGIVLEEADINFGTYDTATQTFTVNELSSDAVRARTYFTRSNGNAAISFLFRLVGRDDFDVVAETVFIAYGKNCITEGYVAEGVVDIQSNNGFGADFCIHSNEFVSINQNNSFATDDEETGEGGSIVSMPDISKLDIPGGVEYDENNEIIPDNFKLNDGLLEALAQYTIDLQPMMNMMDNIVYKYENPQAWADAVANNDYSAFPVPISAPITPDWPSFIDVAQYADATTPLSLNATDISGKGNTTSFTTEELMAVGADVVPVLNDDGSAATDENGDPIFDVLSDGTNRTYYIDCVKGGNENRSAGVTIDASTTPLKDMIIISPCEISFAQGSVIQNSRIVSTSTSPDAITGAQGVVLGDLDNVCDSGSQFISMGGIQFPSELTLAGSQMLAKGDVKFAAGINGMIGGSVIAGGSIDGTSNGDMEVCGSGLLDNITKRFFRMAL